MAGKRHHHDIMLLQQVDVVAGRTKVDTRIRKFAAVNAAGDVIPLGGDNLGNHTATQNLNLATFDIINLGVTNPLINLGVASLSLSTIFSQLNSNLGYRRVVLPSAGTAGIQAAITDMHNAGVKGTVQLLPGDYNGTAAVVWPAASSGIVVRGCGIGATRLNFSIPLTNPATNPWAMDILGAFNPVACGNTTKGDTTITCTTPADAAQFVAKGIVRLRIKDSNNVIRLEKNEVVSANTGTGVVTFVHRIRNTGTTVTCGAYTGGIDNGMQDFSITHPTGGAHAIGLRSALRCFARNVYCDGSTGSGGDGVTMHFSTDCDIENTFIRNYNIIEEYPIGNFADPYGLSLNENLGCAYKKTHFIHSGVSSGTFSANVVMGGPMTDCLFEECVFDSPENTNVYIGGTAYLVGTKFVECKFLNSHQFCIYSANAAFFDDFKIIDSLIDTTHESSGNNWPGIQIITPTYAHNVDISGNTIKGCAGESINIQGIDTLNLERNIVYENNGSCFVYLCQNVSIEGNNFSRNVTDGLWTYQSTQVALTGNTMGNNGRYGLRSDLTSYCAMSGNSAKGNTTKNIFLANTDTYWNIDGNDFGGGVADYGTSLTHKIGVNNDGTARSEWTNFTPTVTLVGGAGNTVPVYTTNTGRYFIKDKTVKVEIFLDGDGGAEGAGTGLIYIALPVAVPANASGWYIPGGFVRNGAASYSALVAPVAGTSTLSLGYLTTTVIADMDGTFQSSTSRLINLEFEYRID